MHRSDRRSSAAWRVFVGGTLREVLETLDRGAMGVAVAIDEHSRIVGLMTDGDVRRAFLSGATLETPLVRHLNRSYTSVPPSVSRAEVLELMHAREIDAVPIVDDDGKVRGLHQLYDVLGIERRPNWAVVMAGGRGARLGAITERIPKPMVRVAGRPILERLVLHLVGHGIERIFLAINYLGHLIEDHFGDGSRFGCRIEYLREERPLGTAGALALLNEAPKESLFVINGDLVTQANIGKMIDFHEAGEHAATIAVRPYFHTVPFGCLELDGDRVVRLEEKPRLARVINAGMYVLAPRVLQSIAQGEETTLPALLDACLTSQEVVRAFEIEEDWIDVGQKEQLQQARGERVRGEGASGE